MTSDEEAEPPPVEGWLFNLPDPSLVSPSAALGVFKNTESHQMSCNLRALKIYAQKEFKPNGSVTKLRQWWERIKKITLAIGYVKVTRFVPYLDYLPRYNDLQVLLVLAERWSDCTNTFHLPELEMGFTPLDFFAITGIPIGYGDPIPWKLDYTEREVLGLLD